MSESDLEIKEGGGYKAVLDEARNLIDSEVAESLRGFANPEKSADGIDFLVNACLEGGYITDGQAKAYREADSLAALALLEPRYLLMTLVTNDSSLSPGLRQSFIDSKNPKTALELYMRRMHDHSVLVSGIKDDRRGAQEV